jgi:hypothetical protein
MLNAMKSGQIGRDERSFPAQIAARGRVLETLRWRRPALLRSGLAFVALAAAVGVGAGFPGVPGGFQIGLAASGYVSFILLFRSAMRRWRTDWDALWDARRRHRRPEVVAPSVDTGLETAPRSLRTQS